MIAEIQIPIEGIPYAFAKYHIEIDSLLALKWLGEVHANISQDVKSAPKELSTQNVLEVQQMKELLEDTVEKSEMKSRLIESLRQELWDEKYNAIREKTLNSDEFKAITKHSTNAPIEA